VYDACVEPERFDDVGYEFLEVPDPVRRRPRRHRRRVAALGVLTGGVVAIVAAAALAVTPSAKAPVRQPVRSAPSGTMEYIGSPVWHHRNAGGRGGHPGANCHHGAFHPSGRGADDSPKL
jgi:hypothetical protein